MMDCQHVRDELELFELEALTPGRHSEIAAHLFECSSCRAVAAQHAALVERIAQSPVKPADPVLIERIKASVRVELDASGRRRLLRGLRWPAAVAAGVLIVLGLWALATTPLDQAPEPIVTPNRPEPETVVVELPPEVRSQLPAVAAIDRAGRNQWQLADNTLGGLSADRRRVFSLVTAGPGRIALTALDGRSGKPLWRLVQESLSGRSRLSRPTVLPGSRVCWTHGSTVHVLDADDGKLLWSTTLPETGSLSSAVSVGDRLLVADSKSLAVLRSDSGTLVARMALPDDSVGVSRPLLASDGRMAFVVQSRNLKPSRLVCLDVQTGTVRWSRNVGRVYDVLCASRGLFIRARNVHRLDTATGRTVWTHTAGGCGALTLADGLLHLVDSGTRTRLLGLDPATGRERWAAPSMRSCEAFLRVDGAAYLRTDDGTVHVMAFHRM